MQKFDLWRQLVDSLDEEDDFLVALFLAFIILLDFFDLLEVKFPAKLFSYIIDFLNYGVLVKYALDLGFCEFTQNLHIFSKIVLPMFILDGLCEAIEDLRVDDRCISGA